MMVGGGGVDLQASADDSDFDISALSHFNPDQSDNAFELHHWL
jgi:hypothetical protein